MYLSYTARLPLCFFRPLPKIIWSGPKNNLPSGRSSLSQFETHLTISNITKSDEGDYVCIATNSKGTVNRTLNIPVEGTSVSPSAFLMIPYI